MFQSIMQSVFITTIAIMILGLVVPVFFSSTANPNAQPGRYVIPISDATEVQQTLTLSYLETLLRQKAPPLAETVLVAYGKGIYLLEDGHKYQDRLQALMQNGLSCYVCARSLAEIEARTGIPPLLQVGVQHIANGQAYVETLMDQGFVNTFA